MAVAEPGADMVEVSPLEDFRRLVEGIASPTASVPDGDRLAELAQRLAAAQSKPKASIRQPAVAIFAGAHGVARHGVSTLAQDAIAARLAALGAGADALNGICAAYNIGLKAYELALDVPTADIAQGPALDERSAAATVAFGMESLAGGVDLLVLAGIGRGGETAAAALGAGVARGEPATWADAPTAPQHVRLRREQAIREALAANGDVSDPLEAMRRLGGREIAAIAGAIAAAASQSVPVILDGEAAAAAALVLHRLNPAACAHCVLAHRLALPAFGAVAESIDLVPLLDLGMFDGDGRAGALAGGLALAAVRT
jgi:nicotinate-nucleotide--dimethylbenzimidazole phosphoribosyltransferase